MEAPRDGLAGDGGRRKDGRRGGSGGKKVKRDDGAVGGPACRRKGQELAREWKKEEGDETDLGLLGLVVVRSRLRRSGREGTDGREKEQRGKEQGNGTDQTTFDETCRSNDVDSAPVPEQVRDDTCAEDHPDIVFCVHFDA